MFALNVIQTRESAGHSTQFADVRSYAALSVELLRRSLLASHSTRDRYRVAADNAQPGQTAPRVDGVAPDFAMRRMPRRPLECVRPPRSDHLRSRLLGVRALDAAERNCRREHRGDRSR